MTEVTPGVVIDCCVPRSPYERAVAVFDYLITMPGSEPDGVTERLDPGHATMNQDPTTRRDTYWDELEDRIIDEINNRLPDSMVCTVGEFQSGDVIIREVQSADDELAAHND